MKQRFVLLAFKIFLSLLVYALVLSFAWRSYSEDRVPQYVEQLFIAIEQNRIDATLDRTHLSVLDWPPSLINKIQSNKIVSLSSEDDIYFYRLKDNFVYQLGPLKAREPQYELLLFNLVYYAGMVLILLAWLWPLLLDLFNLAFKTEQFSKGNKLVMTNIKPNSPIAPVGETFNEMAKQIFDHIELQKSISRMLGHEVRTPMARIQMSISLLKAGAKDSPVIQDEVASMEEDINEVSELTDEFLNLARYEYLGQEFPLLFAQPYDLLTVVIEQFSRISTAEIGLQVEPEASALLEPVSFKRLSQNLIGNAVKHANSRVVVTFKQTDSHNLFIVEDDGRGFTEAEHLEAPFFQESEQQQGYGLGLSIVKMIAGWHQGEMSFETSADLGGARVVFTWPRQSANPSSTHSS